MSRQVSIVACLLSMSLYRPEDQQKIRLAVGLRRVDPSDVPETAKGIATGDGNAGPGPSQKKRKAAFEAAMASSQGSSQHRTQPASSQGPRQIAGPSVSQFPAEVEEVIPEQDEIIDELYCSYNTNIVGVQYYKGEGSAFIWSL